MMQGNQALLGIAGGIVLILMVAGAGFYFESNAKGIAAPPTAPETYQTTGMQTLLTSTNLIKHLVSLQPVPQSDSQATKYSPADIGRTDITKNE